MKLAILPRRPACAGFLISLCIILGLLIVNPAAAQEGNYTHLTMPLGDEANTYAELDTVVPSAYNIEPYEQKVLNYTGGKDVKTSILLNGSRVDIFLLYPCQPPEGLLDAEGLKSLLATVDENILLANYSESELLVGDKPAIWGVLAGSVFAAYQPTNQTAALIVMEGNLDEDTILDLLVNLNIVVDESMSPILLGNCRDNTAVADEAAAIAEDATADVGASMDGAAAVDASTGTETAQTAAVTQTTSDPAQSRKEKAEADRKAAMAKLEEAKAAMKK